MGMTSAIRMRAGTPLKLSSLNKHINTVFFVRYFFFPTCCNLVKFDFLVLFQQKKEFILRIGLSFCPFLATDVSKSCDFLEKNILE